MLGLQIHINYNWYAIMRVVVLVGGGGGGRAEPISLSRIVSYLILDLGDRSLSADNSTGGDADSVAS